jgi:hypothetical protein
MAAPKMCVMQGQKIFRPTHLRLRQERLKNIMAGLSAKTAFSPFKSPQTQLKLP